MRLSSCLLWSAGFVEVTTVINLWVCRSQKGSKFANQVHHQFLQKSDRGQIVYWSIQTALGSGSCSLFVCHHAQKPESCPISDLFNLIPKYFLPLPPSTDPVPPSTNQYRPILTQCHLGPTSTAFYWPSTITYLIHVRLSFVDLRWAQLYVSLVLDCVDL